MLIDGLRRLPRIAYLLRLALYGPALVLLWVAPPWIELALAVTLAVLAWPQGLLLVERHMPGTLLSPLALVGDGLIVAGLCIGCGLHAATTGTFLGALTLSAIYLVGPRSGLASVTIAVSVLGIVVVLGPPSFPPGLQDVLASAVLVFYCAAIAALGLRMNNHLLQRSTLLSEDRRQFAGLTANLRKLVGAELFASVSAGMEVRARQTRRCRLTVFFSDIEGFTALADKMDESQLALMLNDYLGAMTVIAREFGGTIDKFMGDGVMIWFGDPVSRGARDDAVQCVQMALAMRRALAGLRHRWRCDGIEDALRMRIGIHSGYCTVGTFGSDDYLDYTAIGSVVNLASRLESAAMPGEILVSGETAALVRHRAGLTSRGTVIAKGLVEPVAVWAVNGLRPHVGAGLEEDIPGLLLYLDETSVDVERACATLDAARDRVIGAAAEARPATTTQILE